MQARGGRKVAGKPKVDLRLPTLDEVLQGSLVALQFGVLLTILLDIVRR